MAYEIKSKGNNLNANKLSGYESTIFYIQKIEAIENINCRIWENISYNAYTYVCCIPKYRYVCVHTCTHAYITEHYSEEYYSEWINKFFLRHADISMFKSFSKSFKHLSVLPGLYNIFIFVLYCYHFFKFSYYSALLSVLNGRIPYNFHLHYHNFLWFQILSNFSKQSK